MSDAMAYARWRAEAKKRWKNTGLDWLVGESLAGSPDFEPHPGEERFDFPCSQTYRDFYTESQTDIKLSYFFPHTQIGGEGCGVESRVILYKGSLSLERERGTEREETQGGAVSKGQRTPPPGEKREPSVKEVVKEVRKR